MKNVRSGVENAGELNLRRWNLLIKRIGIIAVTATFLLIWLPHFTGGRMPYSDAINTWKGLPPKLQDFLFVIVLAVTIMLLGWRGLSEQRLHYRRLKSIPVRIHVNGSRGKTTVTRLIGSGLREAGLKVLTKTTGKAARLILWTGEEEKIIRLHNPNIREQLAVVAKAAESKVDALVVECMAIQKELQRVSEHKMLHATIGVITNVRPDHLEVLGPKLDDVATGLCTTIPENAIVVTGDKKYYPLIEAIAKNQGSKAVYADPNEISDKYIKKFRYLNFKENVAIALKVCELVGVKRSTALRGFLKAAPDPGVVSIHHIAVPAPDGTKKRLTFINAMGVNDEFSTKIVYMELKRRGFFRGTPIGLFHARGDRVSRTLSFGKAMVKNMQFKKIVLIGRLTNLFTLEALKAGYLKQNIVDLGYTTGAEVLNTLCKLAHDGDTVIACGNMVGELPEQLIAQIRRIEDAAC